MLSNVQYSRSKSASSVPVKWLVYGLALSLLLTMTACSWFGGGKKTDEEREKARQLTEKQLYERVQELLDDERFDLAVRNLQLLESRFPFGVYADQSQLEIIYAYYQNGDEEEAIAAADRFLRLHSDHHDADYAWYMKGLSNYSLKPGLFSRFSKTDHAMRDVEPARQSFREFQQFLQRFPDSPYAADARVRMVYIKDVLARNELVVANYYLKRKAYTAAINRAKGVVLSHQNTQAVPDALALLAFSYYQLGLDQLAEGNLAVLKANYADHPSFDGDGEFRYREVKSKATRSWLNRVSVGLLDAPKAPKFDSRKHYSAKS